MKCVINLFLKQKFYENLYYIASLQSINQSPSTDIYETTQKETENRILVCSHNLIVKCEFNTSDFELMSTSFLTHVRLIFQRLIRDQLLRPDFTSSSLSSLKLMLNLTHIFFTIVILNEYLIKNAVTYQFYCQEYFWLHVIFPKGVL